MIDIGTDNGNNKRIAKNTVLLYTRQLLIMCVAIYTSRVILQNLGVTDFGIYNVVGGIITMLSFITSTLGSASQRYLSYSIGQNDFDGLGNTFSLVCISYIVLTVVTVLVATPVGYYLVNYHMTIPAARLTAANYVFGFTVISFVVQILSAPYIAVIMSFERMDIYAYISIFEVVSKLVIAYIISIVTFDKLIVYSFLLVLATAVVTFLYICYGLRNFKECRFRFYFEKSKFKELCYYALWNVLGALANSLRSQGLNILLSMFFDPAVNAARGIAYQVNNAILTFSHNFFSAVRPQIVKSYAGNNIKRMHQLIFSSSRLSFYLILIIALPISVNAKQILCLWLTTPPEYAEIFLQFILLNSLLEVFSYPLTTGIQATGKIKVFQLTVSTIYLSIVPISYVFLRLGFSPISTVIVNSIVVFLCLIPRLYICWKAYNLSISDYAISVLLRTFAVGCICYLISLALKSYISDDTSLLNLLVCTVSILFLSITVILLLGLSNLEKKIFINNIKQLPLWK